MAKNEQRNSVLEDHFGSLSISWRLISGPKDFLVCKVSALFDDFFVTFRAFILISTVFSRLQSWESLKEVFRMSEGMSSGVFFMSADRIFKIRRLNQSESSKWRKNGDLIGSFPSNIFWVEKIIFQFWGFNHRTANCGKSFTTEEYH